MQAARGATVGTRLRILFASVAASAYVVDLVTKALAVRGLSERTSDVHVVGSLLTLRLTRNPGAAFSTGTAYTGAFSVVAVIAAVAVLWTVRRLGSAGWAVGLGFLMAGIVGNLTDRVFREPGAFRGHVVDFLQLPHWPIFNVADMCINIAAVIILVLAFRGIHLDGRRDSEDDSTRDGTSSEADGTSRDVDEGSSA